MADINFLLQGLEPTDDHLAAVQAVLELPNINNCLVSVAFMNAYGVDLLATQLSAVNNHLHLFVGVRNGVTTKQAIQKLLASGIRPFCVDTATQAYIFHPKVYISCNDTTAKLVVGSANFTSGGLARNVEASVLIDLDLANPNDVAIANSVYAAFDNLKNNHPENVFQITDATDLDALVNEGILLDEETAAPRITARTRGNAQTTPRNHMHLNTRRLSATVRARTYRRTAIPIQPVAGITAQQVVINQSLIWKSKPLSQRDLNIPDGENTNRTGSIYLNRGDPSQDFDFQHYFRNDVFSASEWAFDTRPNRTHIERASVNFRFIIKGIDYGVYELQLSHNTRTDTRTAQQRNALTSLHWGPVRDLIARQDLLGGILCIYAPDDGTDIFKITIDVDE